MPATHKADSVDNPIDALLGTSPSEAVNPIDAALAAPNPVDAALSASAQPTPSASPTTTPEEPGLLRKGAATAAALLPPMLAEIPATLGTAGAVAAAPFTGGVSLGAIPLIRGAVGAAGAAGEAAREAIMGEDLSPRTIAAEVGVAALPFGGVAKPARLGVRVLKGALKGGAFGEVAAWVRSLISRGEVPTAEEQLTGVGIGAAGGGTLTGILGPRKVTQNVTSKGVALAAEPRALPPGATALPATSETAEDIAGLTQAHNWLEARLKALRDVQAPPDYISAAQEELVGIQGRIRLAQERMAMTQKEIEKLQADAGTGKAITEPPTGKTTERPETVAPSTATPPQKFTGVTQEVPEETLRLHRRAPIGDEKLLREELTTLDARQTELTADLEQSWVNATDTQYVEDQLFDVRRRLAIHFADAPTPYVDPHVPVAARQTIHAGMSETSLPPADSPAAQDFAERMGAQVADKLKGESPATIARTSDRAQSWAAVKVMAAQWDQTIQKVAKLSPTQGPILLQRFLNWRDMAERGITDHGERLSVARRALPLVTRVKLGLKSLGLTPTDNDAVLSALLLDTPVEKKLQPLVTEMDKIRNELGDRWQATGAEVHDPQTPTGSRPFAKREHHVMFTVADFPQFETFLLGRDAAKFMAKMEQSKLPDGTYKLPDDVTLPVSKAVQSLRDRLATTPAQPGVASVSMEAALRRDFENLLNTYTTKRFGSLHHVRLLNLKTVEEMREAGLDTDVLRIFNTYIIGANQEIAAAKHFTGTGRFNNTPEFRKQYNNELNPLDWLNDFYRSLDKEGYDPLMEKAGERVLKGAMAKRHMDIILGKAQYDPLHKIAQNAANVINQPANAVLLVTAGMKQYSTYGNAMTVGGTYRGAKAIMFSLGGMRGETKELARAWGTIAPNIMQEISNTVMSTGWSRIITERYGINAADRATRIASTQLGKYYVEDMAAIAAGRRRSIVTKAQAIARLQELNVDIPALEKAGYKWDFDTMGRAVKRFVDITNLRTTAAEQVSHNPYFRLATGLRQYGIQQDFFVKRRVVPYPTRYLRYLLAATATGMTNSAILYGLTDRDQEFGVDFFLNNILYSDMLGFLTGFMARTAGAVVQGDIESAKQGIGQLTSVAALAPGTEAVLGAAALGAGRGVEAGRRALRAVPVGKPFARLFSEAMNVDNESPMHKRNVKVLNDEMIEAVVNTQSDAIAKIAARMADRGVMPDWDRLNQRIATLSWPRRMRIKAMGLVERVFPPTFTQPTMGDIKRRLAGTP